MMCLYSTILCNPIDLAPLKKFAKAVTNKVSQKPPAIVIILSDNKKSGFCTLHVKMNPK